MTQVPIPDDPLEWPTANKSFPSVSAELVASIALGMEDELVIAARHGFSVEDYARLQLNPHFQRAVEAKRAELVKDGVTFRVKAAWMAEELLDKVYLLASRSDASFGQAHEALKTLIKAAGLEPKEEKAQNQGTTFSISIDLGGSQSISLSSSTKAPMAEVITVDAKELPQ